MGRSWSIPLFPVFSIRLELHLTFFLLLIYMAWQGHEAGGTTGALWSTLTILLLFVCVVLHELGHSLTARRFGVQTRRILLLPFGGMAQMDEIPRQPIREFLITLAGPAVNFAIVGLGWGLLALLHRTMDGWETSMLGLTTSGMDLLRVLIVLNLGMGLFNLVPIFPMDGGRLLRSLLAFRLPYLRATRIAVWVAKPLAILGAAFALYTGNLLLALLLAFIYLAGDLEYKMVSYRERWAGKRVAHVTKRFLRTVPPGITLGEAQNLMDHEQPPEIVLFDGRQALAILDADDLADLATKEPPYERLTDLVAPPRVVQASWPLDAFFQQVARPDGEPFAVYDGPAFIGLFRPETLLRPAPRGHRLGQPQPLPPEARA